MVTVRKQCTVCGEPFEAKRNTAKYCSGRCSVRASRKPKDEPERKPVMPRDLLLTTATLAELERAGRVDSPSGVAALILAGRIDIATLIETGSSLAALVREHAVRLADALDSAEPASDPVEDELRAARERRRAVASG